MFPGFPTSRLRERRHYPCHPRVLLSGTGIHEAGQESNMLDFRQQTSEMTKWDRPRKRRSGADFGSDKVGQVTEMAGFVMPSRVFWCRQFQIVFDQLVNAGGSLFIIILSQWMKSGLFFLFWYLLLMVLFFCYTLFGRKKRGFLPLE